MKSNFALRILVSFFAFTLVAVHIWKPELKIDSISGVLLVVCALPWVQPLIKTVELPGLKIELRDLQRQVDEAPGSRGQRVSEGRASDFGARRFPDPAPRFCGGISF